MGLRLWLGFGVGLRLQLGLRLALKIRGSLAWDCGF